MASEELTTEDWMGWLSEGVEMDRDKAADLLMNAVCHGRLWHISPPERVVAMIKGLLQVPDGEALGDRLGLQWWRVLDQRELSTDYVLAVWEWKREVAADAEDLAHQTRPDKVN